MLLKPIEKVSNDIDEIRSSSIFEEKIGKISSSETEEHIPSGTAFAVRPDELCISLDEDKNISYNIVISNLTNNTITPLDKQIIGLIASFGYVTTKQLSEMLALLDCNKPADKLLNNTERLRCLGVIRAFSFGRSKDEKCCMQVFTLCKNGSEIAKAQGKYTGRKPIPID